MYELIEHKKLDAAAASITFSNIPQIYTDLYVVVSTRSTRSATVDGLLFKPNNSTANFSWRRLFGSGQSASSSSGTNPEMALISDSANTANTFASVACYMPNYRANSAKSLSADSVTENNGTAAFQAVYAGLWNDNAPITSLVVASATGFDLVAHSSATLYGINRTQALGAPKAVGGNITYANGYWVHTFTGSGTFYAQEDLEVDALVVAGGGGTGNHIPGGGGAGGFLVSSSILASGSYPVLVGAGGAAGASASVLQGAQGTNSSAFSLTSIGGGYGGTRALNPATGGNGGSGGGGGGGGSGNPVGGGTATSGQGNNGGNGHVFADGRAAGGGGGGAGAVGGAGSFGVGGNGGAGVIWNGAYYAGGGGGCSQNVAGTGGLGGGGNGALFAAGAFPQNGAANTGGGAGGGEGGAVGGSGVVIVRYRG